MPTERKWVVVIILGKYESENKDSYIHIKVRRYDLRKNGLTEKKYVTSTYFVLSYSLGFGIIGSRLSLKKELCITEEDNIETAIKKDKDATGFFNMHNAEIFVDEGTAYCATQYKLKETTTYTISKEKPLNKSNFLSFFDNSCKDYVLGKTDTTPKLLSVRQLNNYSSILLLVSTAIKNRQECYVDIEEKEIEHIYMELFKRGVWLYRKL